MCFSRLGLLLIVGFGCASAHAASPAATAAVLCDGKDALPLVVAGSRHFVDVELKGPKATETIRFHVDSGGNTPGLLLQQAAFNRLGFTDVAQLPKTLRIGGHDVAVPAATSWFVHDAKDIRNEHMSEGQIGAGFFGQFIVCIDPAKGHIAFGNPAAFPIVDDGTGLPIELARMGQNSAPYLFVRSEFGGQKMLLLFDTGASASMLERKYIDLVRADHADWPLIQGAAGDADMLGGKLLEYLLRVPSLVAGGSDLGTAVFVERRDDTWHLMFNVDDAHGAVANDVLDRYRTLIDYRGSHVWLWPTKRPLDASASLVRVGVGLRYGDDQCPVVTAISTGNAPDVAAHVKVNDVILSVDGKSVCDGLHHTAATALAGRAGQVKKLQLRRGDKTTAVTATVRDLAKP
jgi:hypothetical protein